MKKSIVMIGAAAVLLNASCGSDKKPAPEATKTENTAEAAPDSAAMMKAWQDYATPGDMHKMMAANTGTFTADMTMWPTPGAPETKSTGTMETKMILNGLYQQSNYSSEMMGMKFEGIAMMAYDNAKKKFLSTWQDNMGSGMMYMEGDYDAATKTMESKGKQTDPTTGKDCEIREVNKFIDNDNQVMEMYTTPAGGKEFKSMEIKYTRKK